MNFPERLRGQERPFTKATVRVEGDVKQSEDRTPELAGTLFLEARGRGNVFFADGQLRVLRERVLFNLDNLPVFLNPSGSLVKKWTKVESSLLTTRNADQVQEVVAGVLAKAVPAGSESVQGEQLARFRISLTEEEEAALAELMQRSASGNAGLHVLARLLSANRVESLTLWTRGSELRQVQAHFVRPVTEGQEFDFALLTLRFTDYGKKVAFDIPETTLRVRPDVFARIFGGGQVEQVNPEPENQE
jgi:hypothetical protein